LLVILGLEVLRDLAGLLLTRLIQTDLWLNFASGEAGVLTESLHVQVCDFSSVDRSAASESQPSLVLRLLVVKLFIYHRLDSTGERLGLVQVDDHNVIGAGNHTGNDSTVDIVSAPHRSSIIQFLRKAPDILRHGVVLMALSDKFPNR